MASGGTQLAGFVFQKSNKDNRLTIYCPLYHEVWLNFANILKGPSGWTGLFLFSFADGSFP